MQIPHLFFSNNHKTNEKTVQESLKKNNVECECCHIKGHKKDNCYKLVRYPPGHKLHKRNKGLPIGSERKHGKSSYCLTWDFNQYHRLHQLLLLSSLQISISKFWSSQKRNERSTNIKLVGSFLSLKQI